MTGEAFRSSKKYLVIGILTTLAGVVLLLVLLCVILDFLEADASQGTKEAIRQTWPLLVMSPLDLTFAVLLVTTGVALCRVGPETRVRTSKLALAAALVLSTITAVGCGGVVYLAPEVRFFMLPLLPVGIWALVLVRTSYFLHEAGLVGKVIRPCQVLSRVAPRTFAGLMGLLFGVVLVVVVLIYGQYFGPFAGGLLAAIGMGMLCGAWGTSQSGSLASALGRVGSDSPDTRVSASPLSHAVAPDHLNQEDSRVTGEAFRSSKKYLVIGILTTLAGVVLLPVVMFALLTVLAFLSFFQGIGEAWPFLVMSPLYLTLGVMLVKTGLALCRVGPETRVRTSRLGLATALVLSTITALGLLLGSRTLDHDEWRLFMLALAPVGIWILVLAGTSYFLHEAGLVGRVIRPCQLLNRVAPRTFAGLMGLVFGVGLVVVVLIFGPNLGPFVGGLLAAIVMGTLCGAWLTKQPAKYPE